MMGITFCFYECIYKEFGRDCFSVVVCFFLSILFIDVFFFINLVIRKIFPNWSVFYAEGS